MGGLPGNEQMPYTLVPRPAPHPTPLKSQHSHALLRSARSHPTLAYGPSPSPGDAVFRPAARLLCAAARAALGPGVAALLSVCLTLSSAAPTPPTHARTGQLVSSSACAGAGAGAGAGGAGSTGAAPASDIIIVRNVVEWRDLWIYLQSPLLVCFSPSSSSCVRMVSLQRPVPRPTCIPTCIGGMHWRLGGACCLLYP